MSEPVEIYLKGDAVTIRGILASFTEPASVPDAAAAIRDLHEQKAQIEAECLRLDIALKAAENELSTIRINQKLWLSERDNLVSDLAERDETIRQLRGKFVDAVVEQEPAPAPQAPAAQEPSPVALVREPTTTLEQTASAQKEKPKSPRSRKAVTEPRKAKAATRKPTPVLQAPQTAPEPKKLPLGGLLCRVSITALSVETETQAERIGSSLFAKVLTHMADGQMYGLDTLRARGGYADENALRLAFSSHRTMLSRLGLEIYADKINARLVRAG